MASPRPGRAGRPAGPQGVPAPSPRHTAASGSAAARPVVEGGPAPALRALPQQPARQSDDDEVLTVDELVSWLRLSESTVLKLLSERAIPARKVGHQWRVRRGRVRDWLDGRE